LTSVLLLIIMVNLLSTSENRFWFILRLNCGLLSP
jgi:hypothetical protein